MYGPSLIGFEADLTIDEARQLSARRRHVVDVGCGAAGCRAVLGRVMRVN